MRILYHHRTLGDGAEGIHIREMVRAFRALGHEVRVIGPAGETPYEGSAKTKALEGWKRRIPGAVFELIELAYTGYAFWKATAQIRRFKPHFVYDRYITFNAGIVLAGKLHGVPVILEVNAPLALERRQQKDERLTFKRLASWLERWICAHSTRTIVVSTPLREYLESLGVPAGHCTIMPNGVDPARFKPQPPSAELRAGLGIPPDRFVIGFTGVLRAWHGLDLLMEALAILVRDVPDVALLIVGDGPYREELERIARDRGLADALHITGRVAHEKVPEYVSLFDVAVSPRATFYASPMKVMEYMALGKPVVVPSTPNFLDFIDEGVNGVSFADGDAAALAGALRKLCSSRSECARLGAQARDKVERRLNWRWNANAVCRLVAPQDPTGTEAELPETRQW